MSYSDGVLRLAALVEFKSADKVWFCLMSAITGGILLKYILISSVRIRLARLVDGSHKSSILRPS